MSFASPVSKDGFFYNGDLYVEVGDANRHKRATVSELQELLRPDTKKKKVDPSRKPKDQVGHWYEAQLMHYGLPPSKDKSRAKLRLLEALNTGKLEIPEQVKKVEAALKREYNAADRKARAAYKATLDGKEPAGNKRKLQNEDIPQKKAKTDGKSADAAKKSITLGSDVAESTPRKKQTVGRARGGRGGALMSRAVPATQEETQQPAKRPKQTARRSVGRLGAPKISRAEHEEPPKTFRTKQTARRSGGPPMLQRQPAIKGEQRDSPKATIIKSTVHSTPHLGLINGCYDIDCLDISGQWADCDDMTLLLTLDGPRVWGAFDFGVIEGIMLFDNPFTTNAEEIAFKYRGREREGPILYGDSHIGMISFLGDGTIGGHIVWLGTLQFQARRRPGPGTAIRNATSMKYEWDNYNEDVYEQERVGRWG